MKISVPIYVINLKRNPERRLFIQRQLDALNLNYQFVDAIDKFDLESPEYRARISRISGIDEAGLEYKYSKFVRPSKVDKEYGIEGLGHIACLLSHIKTYNLILENNDDIACILEDDAVLLPTFPEILSAAPKFSWDILMFSTHSRTIRRALEKFNGMYRRIIKSYNYVVLVKSRSKEISYTHKHIAKLLGISPSLYPDQSEAVMKILEDYKDKYGDMIKLYNAQQSLVWPLSSTTPRALKSYKDLLGYAVCQLGGLPAKYSRQTMDDHHCLAEPAERPTSAMAYLLNRSVAKKWKSTAADHNTLAIDCIPWHLHRNHQAKLRFISPPCVVSSYNYHKYSTHQKYWNLCI